MIQITSSEENEWDFWKRKVRKTSTKPSCKAKLWLFWCRKP